MVSSYRVKHRLMDATAEAKQMLKDTSYTRLHTEIIDVEDNKLRPNFMYLFNMVGLNKELEAWDHLKQVVEDQLAKYPSTLENDL